MLSDSKTESVVEPCFLSTSAGIFDKYNQTALYVPGLAGLLIIRVEIKMQSTLEGVIEYQNSSANQNIGIPATT